MVRRVPPARDAERCAKRARRELNYKLEKLQAVTAAGSSGTEDDSLSDCILSLADRVDTVTSGDLALAQSLGKQSARIETLTKSFVGVNAKIEALALTRKDLVTDVYDEINSIYDLIEALSEPIKVLKDSEAIKEASDGGEADGADEDDSGSDCEDPSDPVNEVN